MIMGDRCTRRCAFCAVTTAKPGPLDADEPLRVAQAVHAMHLKHVVITSVARDDLPDDGAAHFSRVIAAVRKQSPSVVIEILTADFKAKAASLDLIHHAAPDVFNHNLETVRRLTRKVRSITTYERSLRVLKIMADRAGPSTIKSGFMLGLGETRNEILELLRDLRDHGVEMLTIGQYLRPSAKHHEVEKFYHPDEFDQLKEGALKLGFEQVASGPFVRSSYQAYRSHHHFCDPTTLRTT